MKYCKTLSLLFFSASVALGSTGLMVPGCDTALIHAGGGSTFDPRVGLDRNPLSDTQSFEKLRNGLNRVSSIRDYYANVKRAVLKLPKPKGFWDRRKILSDAMEAQWAHMNRFPQDAVPPLKEFIKEKYRADVLALLDQVEGRTAMAHGDPLPEPATLAERLLYGFKNPLAGLPEVGSELSHSMIIESLPAREDKFTRLAAFSHNAELKYPLETQSSERARDFVENYSVRNSVFLNAGPEILVPLFEKAWPHLSFFSKVEVHLQKYPKRLRLFSMPGMEVPEKHILELHELLQKQILLMFENPSQRVPGLKELTQDFKVLDLYESVRGNVKEYELHETPKLIGQIKETEPTDSPKLVGQKARKPAKEQSLPPPQLASPEFLPLARKPVENIDAAKITSEKVYGWGTNLQTDQIKIASNLIFFRTIHDENASKVTVPLLEKLEKLVAGNEKYSARVASEGPPLLTQALELSQKEMAQLKEVLTQAKENLKDLDAALEPAERELARFENSELKYEPGTELESIHEALLLRRKVLKATRDNANHVVVATKELERKLIEQRSRLDYLGQVFGNVYLYEGAEPKAIAVAIEGGVFP